jgi:CheY-like chemotaxis protein
MSETTILVAEDERHTRDAISLLLENAGYKVFQTDTGKEAVAIINRLRENRNVHKLIDSGCSR